MSRAAVAAALLLPLLGCFRAVSYLDPGGPAYEHRREGSNTARAAPPRSQPFRLASYNIEFALRVARAIEVLRANRALADPDVLLLQEMDDPGVREVARALGMNAVYFPSGVHPEHHRDFGCAVLSPWPLEEPGKLLLPHGARLSGLRRAAVAATVVRGDLRVRVYAVHLPSPRGISAASRRDQVRALLADAARVSLPVVIGGDFNAYEIGTEFVQAGFAWPSRDSGPTTGEHRYDHFFVRGLEPSVEATSPGATAAGVVVNDSGASDHWPIWAAVRER